MPPRRAGGDGAGLRAGTECFTAGYNLKIPSPDPREELIPWQPGDGARSHLAAPAPLSLCVPAGDRNGSARRTGTSPLCGCCWWDKKKSPGQLGDGFHQGQHCRGQAVPPARVMGSGSSCPGDGCDAPRSPGWLRLEEVQCASEFPFLGSHN